jgi:hypothetical protein
MVPFTSDAARQCHRFDDSSINVLMTKLRCKGCQGSRKKLTKRGCRVRGGGGGGTKGRGGRRFWRGSDRGGCLNLDGGGGRGRRRGLSLDSSRGGGGSGGGGGGGLRGRNHGGRRRLGGLNGGCRAGEGQGRAAGSDRGRSCSGSTSNSALTKESRNQHGRHAKERRRAYPGRGARERAPKGGPRSSPSPHLWKGGWGEACRKHDYMHLSRPKGVRRAGPSPSHAGSRCRKAPPQLQGGRLARLDIHGALQGGAKGGARTS